MMNIGDPGERKDAGDDGADFTAFDAADQVLEHEVLLKGQPQNERSFR